MPSEAGRTYCFKKKVKCVYNFWISPIISFLCSTIDRKKVMYICNLFRLWSIIIDQMPWSKMVQIKIVFPCCFWFSLIKLIVKRVNRYILIVPFKDVISPEDVFLKSNGISTKITRNYSAQRRFDLQITYFERFEDLIKINYNFK